MECEAKASEIALNQDNMVHELTVESKQLQLGRYRNELVRWEQRERKRGHILMHATWVLPC